MSINVAVLTLTRDRIDYTKHCFASLHEYAGIEFDHHVLDQGSVDGTAEWLSSDYFVDTAESVTCLPTNIGISRGMNRLLDQIDTHDYDVIVKFDNDCELTIPDTLRDVARLAYNGAVVSPVILGLRNPPPSVGSFHIDGEEILDVAQIGGIFLAAPARIYDTFRYHEDNPYWGMDDVQFCASARACGYRCGYVKRLEAWHYESTVGQHARFPGYFDRVRGEGKAAA